jgi:aryl-alcohol dehydrogenase-like predicted oxidoreductase
MQMRILGKSGLRVSEIGIGGWAIGGIDWNLNMEMGWDNTDDNLSLAGLQRAFELGANHFDTADVYGHGHSECIIGRFLQEVPRHALVVSTKVGYFKGCAPNAYHPIHMRHQLEMSLNNLKTDYIDIYYFHNFHFGENQEYLDGAIESMRRFQQEGKIRFIGLRGPHNYAPLRHTTSVHSEKKYEPFLETASRVQPAVIQVRYNMLSPTFDKQETDIFSWAEAHQVGIVINKPLGQGLLLDKYDPNDPPKFKPGDHRRQKRWFSPEGLRILHRRLMPLKERFGSTTEDLVRVAIQYCLARSSNACVLTGFKNPKQVEMNLSATGHYLTEEDVCFIRSAMMGINEELGNFFAMEQKDE